ncbi:amino acid ABC transporter permease [Microbacterium sp. YY-03]|uniref:amino acid ABC transporter permease n=1 Tax=Microbacterium sp. YY-03 TaxID=3421636 RepID=UPI003D17BF87
MDAITGNLDLWGEAIGNTLILFFGGAVLALVLGTLVGAMRVSPVPIARAVGTVYVNWIRNTPLTLVFFFFVFAYPQLGLPKIDYVPTAVIALGVYTATYVAEAIRAGINTVPVGQAEASRAIGLNYGQVMSLVVLPQAFRAVVPPMLSVLIALLKNTTVAAGFSVAELAAVRAAIADSAGRPGTMLEVLLWVALIFVVLVLLLSWLQRFLENKWRIAR